MGLTDKIAPAAGNLKDTVQAAMQPYAGSVTGGTSRHTAVTHSLHDARWSI